MFIYKIFTNKISLSHPWYERLWKMSHHTHILHREYDLPAECISADSSKHYFRLNPNETFSIKYKPTEYL